ncbi:hypothetical protein F7725_010909 [Dissostichus mawsoni]|uniref:EGF-like domain-containing protein n=1 Tax=Dissostichus mawsoni TaxID=36200 RepID=A0A7J5ZBL1_DISMA|nr:hypothetical protein F7725_010909 [Dissostichus mawsoni]
MSRLLCVSVIAALWSASALSLSDGNQCQSHMCVNGVCVDQYQDYACRCEPGYEGKYCNQRES